MQKVAISVLTFFALISFTFAQVKETSVKEEHLLDEPKDSPDEPKEEKQDIQLPEVLEAMGVELDAGVRQQLEEKRRAEEKLKKLGQGQADTNAPMPEPGTDDPVAVPPAYPPKTPGRENTPSQSAAKDSKVTYEDKSGYKDELYYELTTAIAINVFRSLLDRGVPPAPKAKPISTKSKGPPHRIKDEIVVVSADLAEAGDLERQLASHNLLLKRREVLGNIGIVTSVYQVPSNVSVPELILLLRQEHPAVWMDENNIYRFMDATVFYPKQKIRWPVQETGSCARDLKIGLVDTGVDLNHPALGNQNVVTRTFRVSPAGMQPDDHGTALAVLLVGSPEYPEFAGLLPNAQLYVAEAFDSPGGKRGSTFSTTENVIKALDWLVGEDVRTINLSFGGPRNLVLELVIYKLLIRDFAIIAAAGNGGIDGPPMYPAAQNGVVAVTAIDQRNSLYRSATRGAYIDFAAPGVDIYAASVHDDTGRPRGRYRSGTSYAAPFVASIVAILSNNGQDAYQLLTENAIDLGDSGKDKEFGWGLVQVPFTCP